MIEPILKDSEKRMQKSMEMLSLELAKLRTGRAHPGLLEGIMVSYYGQETPLSQIASINVEDPRTLAVTPWEKTMVEPIDRAIRNSDLGLNPMSAGTIVRVPLPALTEERRKDLTRHMKEIVEAARVSIRNIRRDANTQVKNLLKKKQIAEDDERRAEERIQKLTDKYIADVEKQGHAKEAELMKV